MKTKLINDGPQKTYVLVLEKGDEAVSSIEDFARKNGIAAAQLTGIGAFSDAVLGFFDWETKNYREIPVTEQVEVVSLLGDVALGADRHADAASTRSRQPRRRHRNGRPSPESACPADTGGGADRIASAPAQAEGCRERAGAHRSRGIAGDVGPTASRKDRNRSPAGPHDRRGPLGAGVLPDARNHRHDRRVHRFVGQCVEAIGAN